MLADVSMLFYHILVIYKDTTKTKKENMGKCDTTDGYTVNVFFSLFSISVEVW